MVKFLNKFSQEAMSFDETKLKQLDYLLESFLNSCQDLPSDAFHSIQGRFSPMIFESVFVAICEKPYTTNSAVKGKINCESMRTLKDDPDFHAATQSQTTSLANVKKRLARARQLLFLD
jgi:hypothetical protein